MRKEEKQVSTFEAGASQVDITPPLGSIINGEFTNRYANYIHDPLYAKALILRDSSTVLVFVIVDICAMKRDLLDDVKERIKEATNIPANNILIASTHTHSAGSVAELLMGQVDWAYRERLPRLIVQAVLQALNNTKHVRIAYGHVEKPEHVVVRRYRMQDNYKAYNPVNGQLDKVKTNPMEDAKYILERIAVPDTGLNYLAIQALDGQWISILANYSLHYVGDCDRGTITADYFGRFAHELRDLLGADDSFVAMMSNGCSGDVNIWDFLDTERYPNGNHEKSKFIGKDLATAVCDSLNQVKWENDPALKSVYEEMTIDLRKPTDEELKHAVQVVQSTDYEQIHLDKEGFEQVYAREQVLLAEYADEVTFPVQSFRIGSGFIGALGGEFFAETGLKLKGKFPHNKYFTICFANDYVGYVPPAHEIEKGGYETWRCRTSYLEEKAEELISERLSDQLSNLI